MNQHILSKFTEFERLEHNWDGADAVKIDIKNIEIVKNILNELGTDFEQQLFIYPVSDGGIEFSWPTKSLFCTCNLDGILLADVSNEPSVDLELSHDDNTIQKAVEFIKKSFK
jgi:hypothetical protein